MSLKLALKTLKSLDLTVPDMQVYLYLSKEGPLKIRDLSSALKIKEKQIHLILDKLNNKGMVHSDIKFSVVYTAVSFESVLDEFLRKSEKQIAELQANKDKILAIWASTDKSN